ncbi:MAG TPA: two-component regulator propeller domain-containing protein, partial [Flavisolibacter sp.]|nr:two-component regulator propeller domain-containing protein [Flavisolibacter sp.]
MFCRRLLLLLSLFSSDCLLSQPLEPKYFNHYTTTSGLSHNTVTALAQDSTGYIWITTPYGLNRFNGQQFVQFHSTSDPLSPPAEDLGPAWWLNKELLAVYSSGLHIINTRTGERRNLFVPYHRQQLQYKFNGIVAARGDDDSSIYVLSGSGFYHFNKDHQLLSRYDHYSEAEVPVAYFVFGRELFVLDKNRLLIIAIDGFHVYDKRTRRLKKITAEDVPLLSPFFSYPNDFYTFFQPAPGQLFAIKAHSDSIFYLNFLQNKNQVSRLPFNTGKEGFHWRSRMVRVNDTLFYVSAHETGFYKLQFFPGTGKLQLHPHKYFSDYQCLAMLVDREQKLWVATAKGLFRQDEGRSQVTIAPLPSAVETAYPNTAFDGLFVTADKVLVGARSPGNILVYDKKTLQFLRITDLDAFRKKTGSTFNVYNIEAISDTRLALAVNGPPLLMNRDGTNPQILTLPQWHGWAAEVYNDSKGATWISSMKVYRYHPDEQTVIIPEQELLTNGVEVPEIIREDADHNIWMTRHGLSRYNVLKGRFDLRLDSFPFIKMPDKQVSDMVIDKERNTLWIGSHNNGLMAYEIAAKTFRHFTTADGLPGNNITALIIVGGRLWMTGTVSLACLDLRSLKITGFGKEDGFPDMPILNRADFFYDSLSQQLYIAYSKAVARFNPSALLQRKSPPHVFIESISLNGVPQPLFPQHEVSTAWNRNEISITIGSIHYSPEAGQRFAYRILNDEAAGSWVELGRQPSFSISGLAPGSHRIQVKVYSVNNRWPAQVKELSVVVTPPFWMTAWFISLLSVLVAVSIYQLVRWRTNIVKRKEMIKTQIEKLKA